MQDAIHPKHTQFALDHSRYSVGHRALISPLVWLLASALFEIQTSKMWR